MESRNAGRSFYTEGSNLGSLRREEDSWRDRGLGPDLAVKGSGGTPLDFFDLRYLWDLPNTHGPYG